MDSKRKRSRKNRSEEKLIESGLHSKLDTHDLEEAIIVSEREESKNDSMTVIQNEETLDKKLARKQENGSCFISSPEKVRFYVITIATFIFGLFSIAFGIILLYNPNPRYHSISGGITAISIGLVMLVPACYGITRILTKWIEKRKAKAKNTKEDPVGLTVSSLLDV